FPLAQWGSNPRYPNLGTWSGTVNSTGWNLTFSGIYLGTGFINLVGTLDPKTQIVSWSASGNLTQFVGFSDSGTFDGLNWQSNTLTAWAPFAFSSVAAKNTQTIPTAGDPGQPGIASAQGISSTTTTNSGRLYLGKPVTIISASPFRASVPARPEN